MGCAHISHGCMQSCRHVAGRRGAISLRQLPRWAVKSYCRCKSPAWEIFPVLPGVQKYV